MKGKREIAHRTSFRLFRKKTVVQLFLVTKLAKWNRKKKKTHENMVNPRNGFISRRVRGGSWARKQKTGEALFV